MSIFQIRGLLVNTRATNDIDLTSAAYSLVSYGFVEELPCSVSFYLNERALWLLVGILTTFLLLEQQYIMHIFVDDPLLSTTMDTITHHHGAPGSLYIFIMSV